MDRSGTGTEAWRPLLADTTGVLGVSPDSLTVTGVPSGLSARLPVGDTAVACVGTALAAAGCLRQQRTGTRSAAHLDAGHAAAAVRSEQLVRVAGEDFGNGFAPLSRFWPAADGWVRTHANYAWHREALLRALGTTDDPDAVGSAISERRAEDVEQAVIAAGGVAAAVRGVERWRRHEHGRLTFGRPLVRDSVVGGAPPRRHGPAELPAAGLRVLDLTRVIAGPVATRYLAALGADVLRVDPPHRPELPLHRYDGLPGKRSSVLDARTPDGLDRLHALLDTADVVVHGYRPGALAGFGIDVDALAEWHPGLVVVSISAWGSGPWASRRGFDSIVQAACGIATAESPDGERPGRLPCQLLDHGTGYLAAAAALEGVRRQSLTGGTHGFELSLATTAAWLLGRALPTPTDPAPPTGGPVDRWLTTLSSDAGPVIAVTPPGAVAGRPLRWPPRLTGYTQDPPAWSPSPRRA